MLSFGHHRHHHALACYSKLWFHRFRLGRYMSGSSLKHIEPNLFEQLFSGKSYRWLYNEDVREHIVSFSKKFKSEPRRD